MPAEHGRVYLADVVLSGVSHADHAETAHRPPVDRPPSSATAENGGGAHQQHVLDVLRTPSFLVIPEPVVRPLSQQFQRRSAPGLLRRHVHVVQKRDHCFAWKIWFAFDYSGENYSAGRNGVERECIALYTKNAEIYRKKKKTQIENYELKCWLKIRVLNSTAGPEFWSWFNRFVFIETSNQSLKNY